MINWFSSRGSTQTSFVDNERHLYKAIQEENLQTAGWVRNLENILKSYGTDNPIQNIFKVIFERISKNECNGKHNFLQKRDVAKYFYRCIDDGDKKNFYTKLKQMHDKERNLYLKSFESRKVMAKI